MRTHLTAAGASCGWCWWRRLCSVATMPASGQAAPVAGAGSLAVAQATWAPLTSVYLSSCQFCSFLMFFLKFLFSLSHSDLVSVVCNQELCVAAVCPQRQSSGISEPFHFLPDTPIQMLGVICLWSVPVSVCEYRLGVPGAFTWLWRASRRHLPL